MASAQDKGKGKMHDTYCSMASGQDKGKGKMLPPGEMGRGEHSFAFLNRLASPSPIIQLKLREMDGMENVHNIRMRRDCPFREMMTEYCRSTSLNLYNLAFFFNLQFVSEEETPEMLDMKDGDQIDVMLIKGGG